MRVAFLVRTPGGSDEAEVAIGYAAALRARHDVDARLVVTDAGAPAAEPAGVPVVDLAAVGDGAPFDVAVATGWETRLLVDAVPARRRATLVQSMEDRHYAAGTPERAAAAATHELPLAQITPARWIAALLGALQERPVHHVPTGIDKAVFAIPEQPSVTSGPLRVLVTGRAADPLGGVAEALAACAAAREDMHVTLIARDGASAPGPADVVLGPLAGAERAERSAQADVVLALSRVEGLAIAPLEGFHRGATCLSTPVTGHDEYLQDGVNGLLTSWDDERGTARLLDLLALDRALLAALRRGALQTARAWPSAEEATAALAAALTAIAAGPVPEPAGAR
jgi:glycosyltransferase involved in cell wall biosynthesis